MSAAQTKSSDTLPNDRLLSMRQIPDRWGLKTTAAALERITKASIPIVRLNGKTCSAYLSEILALERKATHREMPPTERRASPNLKSKRQRRPADLGKTLTTKNIESIS